ncbi:uncharacterized protein N7482_005799 [Penicillium canariense]|uniref:BRCT domain-containing protein n=1 Tax=Penicillium canariense TaxID=189055 RepID=A0A9W9LNS8_9EURO|nr:uncharacterized protein N7482_005799 [Penicillium canariense]KAJ5167018.1 hypothetical protein N7482_005799 [Penicillium canariense]
MGKAFQRIRASAVGDLHQGDRISQWVRKNGGEFLNKVTDRVTHLIASEKAYKENVEQVQVARALGTVKIVSRDWLIASLYANPIRPVPEAPFLLENLVKPSRKAANEDPFARNRIPTGSKSTKAIAPPKKQIYRQPQTREAWDAVLTRATKASGRREKYRLAIFETTSQPHTYSTWSKYSRVGTSRIEELTPPKSDVVLATNIFKKFFKVETGKEWDDKNDDKLPMPKTDAQGNPLPVHEGWYSYESKTSMLTSFIMQVGQPVGSNSAPVESENTSSELYDQAIPPKPCAQPREDSTDNGDVDSNGCNDIDFR